MLKKLNFKISLTLITTVVVLFTVSAFYNYKTLKSTLYIQLEANAQAVASRLAKNLPEPVWNYMESTVSKLVEAELTAQEIEAVVVQTEEGVLTAQLEGQNGEAIAIDSQTLAKKSFYKEFETPIVFEAGMEQQHIGDVIIFVTDDHVVQLLQAELMKDLIQILAIALLLFAVHMMLLKKFITQPLNRVKKAIEGLTRGNGDLCQRLDESEHGEMGELSQSINGFIGSLQGTIRELVQGCVSLNRTSNKAERLAKGTQDVLDAEREEIAQFTSSLKEVHGTIDKVAAQAKLACESTETAMQTASRGQEQAQQILENVNELISTEVRHNDAAANNENLNADSSLDNMRNIAKRMDIIALNAAMTATRVGPLSEEVTGFADEVRTLAKRVGVSIEEIEQVMGKSQTNTAQASSSIATMHTEQLQQELQKLKQTFAMVTQDLTQALVAINQIVSASEGHDVVTTDIGDKIKQMNEVIIQRVKASQHSAEDVKEIRRLSHHIEGLVQRFRA